MWANVRSNLVWLLAIGLGVGLSYLVTLLGASEWVVMASGLGGVSGCLWYGNRRKWLV